jgi:hypothetical protein
MRLVSKTRLEQDSGEHELAIDSELDLFDAAQPVAFGKVKGQLTQARVFIAKCVRDLPCITAKTTLRPTTAERARICMEAARIDVGAGLIVGMCECKLLGVVKRPKASGRDRLRVGQRYSPWIDPLGDALAGWI